MKTSGALPLCKRLRTKEYYVMGPEEVDLHEYSSSSASSCWCARTLTILGPDDTLCAPGICRPGRACFEGRQASG